MKFTVGSDIEYFVVNNKDQKVLPADLYLPNSKDSPMKCNKGYMHWDNILAEICPTEADNANDFTNNITQMQHALLDLLSHSGSSYARFASAYISNALSKMPSANIFGCDPDISAYTRTIRRITPKQAGKLRTAGGHIHIGIPEIKLSGQQRTLLVYLCDMYLGVPSVCIDADKQRRTLYGQAGVYRAKSYGIEYRTLSNFWSLTTNRMNWVFNQVNSIIALFSIIRDDKLEDLLSESVLQHMQDIINLGNMGNAKKFIKQHHIDTP